MYDIDANVLAQLGGSHAVSARLWASVNRSAFSYPVQLDSGTVSVDMKSPIRRKLTARIKAKLTDPECDAFRTEIRAEYGISINNFTWFWFPVGTFVVTKAVASGGMVEITGEDRWKRVQNARFLQPMVTSGKHTDAIVSMIEGADGRISCIDHTGKTSIHRSSVWERDRDKSVLQLSGAIATDVYFDPMGVAGIWDTPVLNPANAWAISGGDGGALIDVREGVGQDRTYNAIVAEGEDTSGNVAVRAVATISDPSSKLFFGGGFAQKPRFYRSSLLTTTTQCQNVADSMLLRHSGIAKEIEIESFINPALEAGDTVYVELEPGVRQYHLVESFVIPLGPGGTVLNTRTFEDEETE